MQPGDFCRHPTRIPEKTVFEHFNEAVQAGFPVLHGQRDVALGHVLGEVQIGGDHAVQLPKLVLGEVVLGDGHVGLFDLAVRRVLPGGQTHVILRVVGALHDELGGGVPVHGEVHLVLHRGIEAFRGGGSTVVVDSSGIQVGDLLIELALAGTDLPDALQLFLKVFVGQIGALLEPFVVHDPAANGVLRCDLIDPFAELNGALGIDLEADRDDHLKRVMVGGIAFAVCGSYPKFSDN